MRSFSYGRAVMLLTATLLAACSSAAAPTDAPTAAPTAALPPTEPAQEALTPAALVSDQDATQGSVVIDEVTAAEPGWIVIHTSVDGAPGPVIGYSTVQTGENLEVPVEIELASATDQLFAMLHVDRGAVGTYEFPGDDVPARAGEAIVNVPFAVTLPALEPSVTASDQSAVNGMVTIDQVVAAEAGWIVIHIDADGAPGPIIGYAPVTAGRNADVVVEIDLEQATPTLHAMLHLDAGQIGTYEFPGEDGPVRAGDAIVMAPFQLLESEAGGAPTTVAIVDGGYREREISVPVGTAVVWTSQASAPHTVTADDGSFDSGTLQSGSSFSFTFDSAGTYPYFCEFHGGRGGTGMSGVVVVTP